MGSEPRILCVYQSGGEFTVNHVRRLTDQLHGKMGARPLVCLTDHPADVERISGVAPMPLTRRWPRNGAKFGCWCKMEIYRVPGPVLYLDLDMNVVGDLEPLLEEAARHDLIMNRDFWGMDPPYVNASLIGWRAGSPAAERIWWEFEADSDGIITRYEHGAERYKEAKRFSDQGFIADLIGIDAIATWQELLPGSVLSFKNQVRHGADMSRCKVVASHGLPRPWDKDGADSWLSR